MYYLKDIFKDYGINSPLVKVDILKPLDDDNELDELINDGDEDDGEESEEEVD